jgi:Flp pilus assembly protein CpaB
MSYRLRNVGIAIILALLAAMLTFFYVGNYKQNVRQGEELVTVYVAKHDVPVGATGSELVDDEAFSTQDVARRNVVPGAISSPDQVERLVATQAIFAGEQVSTRRFAPITEQGLRGQLKGNLRALQVPGTEHQLLLGTLRAGDHVDVVGTWIYPEESQTHVSRVVLRNLLVLRAPDQGRVASKIGQGGNEPFSAVLAVSDTQSKKLWWLMENGQWALSLRAMRKAEDSPDTIETQHTMVRDGLRRKGGRR